MTDNFDPLGIISSNENFKQENPEEYYKIERENKRNKFNKTLIDNSYNATIEDLSPDKRIIWIRTNNNNVFQVEIHIDLEDFKFNKGDKVKIGVADYRHILYEIIPPIQENNETIKEQEKAFKELGGDY